MNPDQTIMLNQIAMNIDQSILMLYRINYTLLFILLFLAPLIKVFFSWTCYATMKKIPSDKQTMPAWCCWLFVIPIVGYIFEWIIWYLENGGDLKNKPQNWLETVHIAANFGRIEILDWLKIKGVDIFTKDKLGRSGLHMGAESGHLSVVQWYVQHGADLNYQTQNGMTPAHCAVSGHS
jgi:hypothetical protein